MPVPSYHCQYITLRGFVSRGHPLPCPKQGLAFIPVAEARDLSLGEDNYNASYAKALDDLRIDLHILLHGYLHRIPDIDIQFTVHSMYPHLTMFRYVRQQNTQTQGHRQ